ncbi:mitoferrin-1 [Parasteatoda tepidariorum]|uniref:mitoferrin-1 n=1 Tax=Parasteatoda tepidariorum TaxID=114398 RepID=UPI001C71E404|nr:mitoferrin-1-like [Parasteatoda tepidariorum]
MEHEGIQDFSKISHQAMAGAITGLVEYSVMYPIDLIKTRMQTLRPYSKANYKSVFGGLLKINSEEGMLRLFRGMPLPLVASIPAHALYYSTYEVMKRMLSGTEFGTKNPIAQSAAGALAITNHNIVMNPADVVKQRMQIYGSPYKSSFHCLKSILKSEGVIALYRSLPTQMAIDAPYGALHFVIYETIQNFLNPSRAFDAKSHILSGAIAGGFAAAATTPLDVCRTLLNTQEGAVLGEAERNKIRGLFPALVTVYKMQGLKGFTRGMKARVMHHVPSTAICWCVYEFFKHYFSEKGN